MRSFTTILVVTALAACAVVAGTPSSRAAEKERKNTMELGTFSISLAVKNLETSRTFYEKLGFEEIAGDATQNWLILQNGTSTIGLFQGMFEQNILTFNPGWDSKSNTLEKFQDVRNIQSELKKHGLELETEAEESTDGPASLMVIDPDGNPILIDQHVSSPGT